MSSGESFRVTEIKEFQNADGTLNAKGKYFKTRDNKATGFDAMITILTILLLFVAVIAGTRWWTKRSAARKAKNSTTSNNSLDRELASSSSSGVTP